MEIISGYVEVHIFRRDNVSLKYLLLKRGEDEIYPGLWQMVTGKIKKGEKAYQTALREMKEETGLVPLRFWTAPKVNQFYQSERDAVFIVPVFAAEVSKGDVKICREHSKYKWVSPAQARRLFAWEEQKKANDIITAYVLKMPGYLDLVEIKLK